MIKSRIMRRAGLAARMGKRCIQEILVGKPEGKRPLGRRGRRCEDNIKMDFHAVGWGTWTGLLWFSIETGGGHL
jgi:hypothetical protein